jgi:two-component system phosphate regulon response regulator PhoB
LVEDDREQASLFASVLTMSGYEVVTELTAETALPRIIENGFALVLVDWDLPGMKGDDLITAVKAHNPCVKTVLFSNHANIEPAARGVGADAWMLKTEGILRLREIVTELLQHA